MSVKVLFLGNSYTFFNDMPDTFAALCEENGIDVEVSRVLKGGYTLQSYLEPSDIYARRFAKAMREKKFDYVVIQEQSVRPASHPDRFLSAAKTICDTVKANGAVPVFYATWGRRDDSETLVKYSWANCEEMLDLLRESYTRAAIENDALVAYVGDAMLEAYRTDKGEGVYHPDGSHPSAIGSEIAARTIAETILNSEK
jgi:hypothetical protein